MIHTQLNKCNLISLRGWNAGTIAPTDESVYSVNILFTMASKKVYLHYFVFFIILVLILILLCITAASVVSLLTKSAKRKCYHWTMNRKKSKITVGKTMVSKEFLADNLNTPNLFDGRIVARRRAGQFFFYDVQSHGALVGVSIRALLGVSLVVAYESTAISKDVIYAGSPGMCTRCIAALLFWSQHWALWLVFQLEPCLVFQLDLCCVLLHFSFGASTGCCGWCFSWSLAWCFNWSFAWCVIGLSSGALLGVSIGALLIYQLTLLLRFSSIGSLICRDIYT